jgi:hypothetical protein
MRASFVWIAAQTTTPGYRHTGAPGQAWIVVVLAVAFLVAVCGLVMAGWVAIRGSFLTRPVTPWQRRVFGLSAVSFVLPFLVLLVEFLGYRPAG